MNAVEYAVKFLCIQEGEVDPSVYVEIEDCGEFYPELSGVKLCFPESRVEELADFIGSKEASREHFLKTYRINPKEIVSYPSLLERRSFTESLMQYYETPEELFKAFGLSWVRLPETEIEEDVVLFSEDEEISEDINNEVHISESIEEREDKEEEYNLPKEIKEAPLSLSREELKILTGTSKEDEVEEPSNEDSDTKIIPRFTDENPYNEMSVLEQINYFNQHAINIPKLHSEIRKFASAITGRKLPLSLVELSEREFETFIEYLDRIPPEEVKYAFRVVLRRFWRFGDVELVTRVTNEILDYFEEVEVRNARREE